LATGERQLGRGFTLIEIIIVIALMGIIGGLVVINANSVLQGLGDDPVDRSLVKAVREARYQAAANKQTVRLQFDEQERQWLITSTSGQQLDARPIAGSTEQRLDVRFEQILPSRGLQAPSSLQMAEIPAVFFRPDRSATAFQAVIREGTLQYVLRFDPFSDIVIHDSRERD
jgi:prepilin-type N-terminal cleavage/methylation domain-containing protein